MTGWVQDMSAPYEPVSLLVTIDGKLLARVLANGYRHDLDDARVGCGRHGFEAAIDSLMLPLNTCQITIQREEDGTHIPGSPVLLRPIQALGQTVQADITALLEAPCDDVELRARLAFLAAQTERLLALHADRLSRSSDRLAATQHARRWTGREYATVPPMARQALVIDKTSPVGGRDAGSNAILSHIGSLRRLGYEVTFVPADMTPPSDPTMLDCLGATICHAPWFASVEEVLRRFEGDFDLVYLHRVEVAACYTGLVRRHLPQARLIYSVADLQHLSLQRQAALQDRPELAAVAHHVRVQELTAAWLADAVLTHSSAEAALLRPILPPGRVHLIRWAIPPRPVTVPFVDRNGIAFIGSFGHPPNVDAAIWLVEAIMPLVWTQAPTIACVLAGSLMPESVRGLARPGVTVLGQVAKLPDVFNKVRLTVAPLAFGAGVKGKVLDSLAAGIPCACTPVAAEGLDLPAGLSAQIGSDAATLAAAILRLHADPVLNAACATLGLEYTVEHLSEAGLDSALQLAIGHIG